MAGQSRLPESRSYFPLRHKILRAVWSIVWLVCASWTPKTLAPWRRFLLRQFGAQIEGNSDVRGSARVWYPPNLEMASNSILAEGVQCYNMAKVRVGLGSIVSQRAFLCGGTHDYSTPSHPLICRPIEIGPRVWIAAEAFVGPGTVVGEGCVVGARAVVKGMLEPWGVYAGNPARRIKEREFG